MTRRNIVEVAGGATLTVDAAPLAEFVPGTASVGVSIGGASTLDVAGILAALDRYPYGCAEQLTSRALPLVYLNDVAVAIGAGDRQGDRRAGADRDRGRARQPVVLGLASASGGPIAAATSGSTPTSPTS